MKIEEVALGLRRLRRHLDATGTHPTTKWSALVDRYDRALLDACVMLQVPTPSMARGRHILTAEDRAELERALAEAGLDVRQALPGGTR